MTLPVTLRKGALTYLKWRPAVRLCNAKPLNK
jgi:hypothetical protein